MENGFDRSFLNLITSTRKPIANIVFNSDSFTWKLGTREECPLLTVLQHVTGRSSQHNKIKCINQRGRNKICPISR